IAGMLGVPFDSLRRRDLEARARAFRRFAMIAVSLTLLFAGLAAAAGWFAWQSERESARAAANLETAIDAAVSITLELADKSKNAIGIQRRTVLSLYAKAMDLLDRLTRGQELTPWGRRAQAVALSASSRSLSESDPAEALKRS